MGIPAYSNIPKNSNDLLSRDFYHLSKASIDVKTKAPKGVSFAVKGNSSHKDSTVAANLEAKFADKASGLTLTQGWTTSNVLNTKIEADALPNGLKAELATSVIPTGAKSAKLNLYFSQPSVNARAFFNLLNKPSFVGDITLGHDGFIAGTEVGYDISAAKVTKYSAAVGYSAPIYAASVIANNNLSVFTFGYYHKVTPFTEVATRAIWNSNSTSTKPVSFELASKHKLDPGAFVKVKIDDNGIASLAYSQVLKPGVKIGLGTLIDALRPQEPVHKLGLSLSFEA